MPRDVLTNATVSEAAEHIRMTPKNFRSLVTRGIIPAADGRGYDLAAVRGAYFDHMRTLIATKTKNGPLDPEQESARKNKEVADRVALQNDATRANLVPTSEIQVVIDLSYTRFRDRLMPLAARLAPRLEGKPRSEAKAILEEAIHSTLAELTQDKFE